MAVRLGNSPALGAMRRPLQKPIQTMQQPLPDSPAIQAMGGVSRPTSGPAATLPTAGGPQTPGAGTPPRTDLATPTNVDTSGSEAAYDAALQNNQGMIDEQRKYGENYLNALQRRNGSNAALTGMSIGGGSYMGGQRAAFTTGIQSLNQSLLPFQQNATNILNTKAGTLANAAGANANAANNANQHNADRNAVVDDRAAEAGATNRANQMENSAKNVLDGLKSAGVDVAGQHGATWKQGSDLYTAYVNTEAGSPEQAAAFAKLQTYASKVAQAAAWQHGQGNIPQQFVPPDSKTFQDRDLYMKWLEQQGYFNV